MSTNTEISLIECCKSGQYSKVVEYFDKDKDHVIMYRNRLLREALGYGHFDIVNFAVSIGATDWMQAFEYVSTLNNRNFADMIKISEIILKQASMESGYYKEKLLGYALYFAACSGSVEVTTNIIKSFALEKEKLSYGFIGACRGGNLDIVKLMFDKEFCSVHDGLVDAARYGHTNIVRFLMENDLDNISHAFNNACRGGNIETINFIIESLSTVFVTHYWGMAEGIVDYSDALCFGCMGGHIDVVNMFLEKNIKVEQAAFVNACMSGKFEIIELIIEKLRARNKSIKWNYGLLGACVGGHIDVVIYMLDKCHENFDGDLLYVSFLEACVGGHLSIMKLLIERSIKLEIPLNFNKGFKKACSRGYLEIVEYLSEHYSKSINIEVGYDKALENCHSDIIAYLKNKIDNVNI